MNKDNLISKDEYINGFKSGSIIYPNVFARYYGLEIKDGMVLFMIIKHLHQS